MDDDDDDGDDDDAVAAAAACRWTMTGWLPLTDMCKCQLVCTYVNMGGKM